MNTKNKIKKLFSLAIVVMALLSFTAGAAETIYESFDYTAGTDLTGAGGFGFDGAWSTTSSDALYPLFTVKDGSLSLSILDTGGVYVLDVAGNSAYRATDTGRAEANRPISAASQTALLADSSTIWFSVLYVNDTSNVSAFVIGTDTFDPNDGWDLTSYPDTGEGFGFGMEGGSTIKAIAFDGTATPITDDSGVTASAAKLIAGKIIWASSSGGDKLSLYEVTDLTTEPITPIATVTAYLDQSTFDRVALQHNNNTAVFDEIRFGATFADVSPFTFVPDLVPPTVTELSPADDSTDGTGDSDLVAIFSENIVVGTGNITIKNLTDETETVIDVADDEQVSVAGATLTINPTDDLEGGKNYAIQIDATAIEDFAANTYAGIADDTTWNFTIESTPPTVTELSPADDATDEMGNSDLVAIFSEDIVLGIGNITIKNLTDTTEAVIDVADDEQVSVAGATLTINPTDNLEGGKNYAIQIDATAIEDLSGNTYAGIADDTTWNFTTESASPTVTELSPADDAIKEMGYSDLVATFNENIVVGIGNITIRNLTDETEIVIAVDSAQVSVDGNVLTINPNVNLEPSKDYAIRIDAGAIEDLAANAYAGIADDTTWNFTTSSAKRLVYEPFDYEIGEDEDYLVIANVPVGEFTGLTGKWNSNYGTSTTRIVNWSNTFSTLPVAGGSYVGSLNSDPEIDADLDPCAVDGYLNDEFWFSFNGGWVGNQATDYLNNIRLQIGDISNNVCLYTSNKSQYTGRLQTSITVGGYETVSDDEGTFEVGSRWCVARVTFGPDDPNSITVDAYLPEIDLELPDEPVATVRGYISDPDFTKLAVRISNGNTLGLDEIKIGTTFGSLGGVPYDADRPSVNAGVDMVSWSGGFVPMDAIVVNKDPEEPELTYEWSVEPDALGGDIESVVFEPGPDVEDPCVTIIKTAPTGEATTVTITLTVTRAGSTPKSDTITIDVYDTGCEAKIAVSTVDFDPSTGFCVIDGAIGNADFYVPIMPEEIEYWKDRDGWEYEPNEATWAFDPCSGIAGCESIWQPMLAYFYTNQFAFLQKATAISQELTGLVIGSSYSVSFYESYTWVKNVSGNGAGNDLSVIIDEGLPTEVTLYNNPNVNWPFSFWELRKPTRSFTASATSHTLTFRTTNPLGGDLTTIIDRVSLVNTFCVMQKFAGGESVDPTDVNGDCVSNLKDAAILSQTWLNDNYAVEGPIEKP